MSLASPDILSSLLARVEPVGAESVALDAAHGRALAQAVAADRDSPACDVSAVDGYAVRLWHGLSAHVSHGHPARGGGKDAAADTWAESPCHIPVAFEVPAGSPAPALPLGACARVFTGAPVPAGAEAMVPREKTDETNQARIGFLVSPRLGDNIRRQGENLRLGEAALEAGKEINAAVAGSLSLLGVAAPQVFKRLKVAVLITGDEVLGASDAPQPWQVRDANGPALRALLAPLPWVESVAARFVKDEPGVLKEAIAAALSACDALILTGGVSAGDLDFVPRVLQEAGCEILFHKLSIRPGKPLLGAITADGRPVFGLPGNPVAVMTCARRFAIPALRARAGLRAAQPTLVEVVAGDAKTLDLTWFRPVRLIGPGKAQVIPTQGSGDPVGAARGDGFVEVSAGQTCAGWLPFFPW